MYFQIVSSEPDSQLFQLVSARWLVFIMNKAMWIAELFKLRLLCLTRKKTDDLPTDGIGHIKLGALQDGIFPLWPVGSEVKWQGD